MHLKTIKLAGFKSFVDPITVLLQSHLTAVVGPNGCGKSNIVDAIRWVIGESSARQLRGELLTDVIFNGTTGRKPVGQASIELLFDNSQGRWGGAYAQYNQLALRREISRDGQSQFYLNGSRCRRRDITDIFLGTGLGPSSYAIIEQGVISKIIESKPEELRIYLEEAAGISKYRERRRETENRIKNTRENLARLSDLRQEIEKQLEHLKRQANAAERYKNHKQEQQLYKAQLHALHCQEMVHQLDEKHQLLTEQSTHLEAKLADNRRVEREIESQRDQQNEANDCLNSIQAHYYSLGTDIARQEQQIAHIQERERQLTTDLARLEQSWQEAEQHVMDDQEQIETITYDLTTLEPQSAEKAQVAAESATQWQQAEHQLNEWQNQWDRFQTEAAQATQKLQVEQTRLQHLTQKKQGIEQRIARAQEQQQNSTLSALPEEIAQWDQQSSQLKGQLEGLHASLAELNEEIQTQRQNNQHAQSARDNAQQELHHLLSRQSSLQALQQAALGKTETGVTEWLTEQGWVDKPRLLENIRVEIGWEYAVETVLEPYLEAICIESSDDIATAAERFSRGRLALFNTVGTDALPTLLPEAPSSGLRAPSPTREEGKYLTAVTLASKVQSQLALENLLAGIFVANSITEALAIAPSLAAHESVVMPDGTWFGASWLRIRKNHDPSQGILHRKQALEEIQGLIESQQSVLQQHQEQLQASQQRLSTLEEQRDSNQRLFRETSTQYNDAHTKFSAKQAQLEQLQKRCESINQELQEQQQLLTETITQIGETETAATQAMAQQQSFEANRQQLLQTRDRYREQFQQRRQQAQADKQAADECQVRVSSLQSQLHYLQQNITRAQKQLSQLQDRREELTRLQGEILQPLPQLREALQELLTSRLAVDKELNDAREKVNQLAQQLRDLEKQRSMLETEAQTVRESLEQIRIEQSSLQAHQAHHLEEIQATSFSLENLLQEMPSEANITQWQERLAQIEERIRRLGAINLAAIDEYNASLERKTYLDSQDKDLCDALATLEEAIRKIDRESRERLRETFNKANDYFKELFTKVFEGGNAELELTGDELLNAGVVIRAQPPGKRNSLLHLLSGGEKALTAIALVFALFQLNPAPFCVLDEVDAPLDEANVRRFCRLVESMSTTVQFIFITHNKVTMEMAKQLVGITMHEPGVSRLVSVDIDQAMAMVED
jgi:chromosome segregation protein